MLPTFQFITVVAVTQIVSKLSTYHYQLAIFVWHKNS